MMMYNDSYCKHKDYIFSYLLVYITILKSVSWHIKVTTIPYSNIYDFNRVLSFLVKHEIKYRSEEQKQLSLTKWIMNCLPKKPSWSRLVPAFNVFMCFWPVLLVCKQKARLRLRFSFSILLQCFSLCWNTTQGKVNTVVLGLLNIPSTIMEHKHRWMTSTPTEDQMSVKSAFSG